MAPKHVKSRIQKTVKTGTDRSTKNKLKHVAAAGEPTAAEIESAADPFALLSTTRATSTHIYFWHGILSNWCCSSPRFSGARCFELSVVQLDELEIPHPNLNALSTQLIHDHEFNCGEQWMMAAKSWLFEQTVGLSEWQVDLTLKRASDTQDGGKPSSTSTAPSPDPGSFRVLDKKEYEDLRKILMEPQTKTDEEEKSSIPNLRSLHSTTLLQILRTTIPRTQKSLGRTCPNFDPDLWNKASTSLVTASCIARAEVDIRMRTIYLAGGDRKYVEGSPRDRIWGVGLSWKGPAIDDEKLWRGQNRLGVCHDLAAVAIRETFGKKDIVL